MTDLQIRAAAEKEPTPLFIFESGVFDGHFRELEAAYRAHYERFRIAYSFKTNYTPAIAKRVLALGGMAEVVSGMEYRLARRLGFAAADVICNGPGKFDALEQMLTDGALVVLDNGFEARQCAEIARRAERPVRVAFRLNFEIGSGKNSRFGFDVLDPETEQLIRALREAPNVCIEGIHFHLSGARSLEAWRTRAEKMADFAERLLLPEERKIIDLGSGMFGHMAPEFAAQFPIQAPTFAQYGAAVAGVFAERFGTQTEKPLLVAEPGTTLVADTVSYLTRVIALKTVRGRHIAIVDGSAQQLGELCKHKQLPVTVVPCGESVPRMESAELTGFTCLEDDILCKACPAAVGEGDLVLFGNAGSYSNVLAPNFIRPGCGMVQLDADGTVTQIKRAHTDEDVFVSYGF